MAEEEVKISIGARIDGLLAAVSATNASLKSIEGSISGLKSGFETLGKLIGITFTVGGLVSFVEHMADLGVTANRVYSQIGGTKEQMGQFKAMAALTGTDVETLITSVTRASLAIQRSTNDAFGPAAQGLKALGLRAKDLIGLSPADFMMKFGDAMSKFEPSVNRTTAAMAAAGRGVLVMMPAFDLGRDAFKKFDAAYQALGAGVDIKSFASTNAELILLEKAFSRVGVIIFSVFQPAINAAIKYVREFVGSIKPDQIRDAVEEIFDALIGITASIAGFFIVARHEIEQTLGWMSRFADGAASVKNSVVSQLKSVSDAWFGAKADTEIPFVGPKQETALEAMQRRLKAVADAAKTARETVRELLDETGRDGNKKPPGDIAPPPNFDARRQAQITETAIAAELALEQNKFDKKKMMYDLDAQLGAITNLQKIDLTKRATEEQFQIELALLKRKADLYKEDELLHKQKLHEVLQLELKRNLEMQNLQGQAALDIKAKYDEVFGALESSISGTMRGLLSGTMSFAEAFKNIMGDMTLFFIKKLQHMAFEWLSTKATEVQVAIMGEQAKTAAAVAGEGAKTAAAEAGMGTRLALGLVEVMKSIGQAVAEIFAELTAWLVPVFGPAAPAAALGIAAGVGATAVGLIGGKFDTGSWSVPRDMIAMVHEGEQITPKGAQGGGWQGNSSGSQTVVNISAVDARSVAAWASDHAQSLAAAVTGYQGRNPSARGAY